MFTWPHICNDGIESKYEDVLENLEMRDFYDSTRENSPLIQVKDAFLIDNSSLSIDEQFNLIIQMLK